MYIFITTKGLKKSISDCSITIAVVRRDDYKIKKLSTKTRFKNENFISFAPVSFAHMMKKRKNKKTKGIQAYILMNPMNIGKNSILPDQVPAEEIIISSALLSNPGSKKYFSVTRCSLSRKQILL